MALHTSTLILYKNSALEIDRNFMVDSIADYLATLSDSKTISSFQYIKHGLAINIKIDITQATLDYISANNYNYCSIKNDDGRLVYYYIVGKQWRGQSTIELNLQMDTINTFALGTDYTLSKQSVVNREHKDRYTMITPPSETKVGYTYGDADTQEWDDTLAIYGISGEVDDFSIALIEKGDSDTIVRGVSITLTSWSQAGTSISCNLHIRINSLSDIGNFLDRNVYFKIDYADVYCRKIDKFAEGISPVLYKRDIAQLEDADGGESWYLIYKNANAVITNPDATEVKAVNPIQILLCKDTRMKRVSSTLQSVRVYCSDIPRLSGVRENVVFCYADLTAEQLGLGATTITINGTTYTLKPIADVDIPNNKVYAVVWTRINNTDLTGTIRIYSDNQHIASTITDVSYIDVYNYISAKINSAISYEGTLSLSAGVFIAETSAYLEVNSGQNGTTDDVYCIQDVDLTDSQLIKIIALPYCPVSDFIGVKEISLMPSYTVWNSGAHMIEMKTTNIFNFDYIKEMSHNPANELLHSPLLTPAQPKNIQYESKLYMSEFYYQKFVYGAYSFQFSLEYYDIENSDIFNFNIEYAVSQSVQSKFLFKFNSYITDGYDTQDYNDVLVIGMNNEKAIYSNSYINYIRSGQYTNDIKNMNNAKAMSWLGVGLGAIGTIASFVSAPFTGGLSIAGGIGMATSTFGQIANAVNSANKNERNLEQKKQSLARQSESVSAVEDIDLLKVYSNNKPKMVEYHPSEIMKNALYDLFFYCGYATREYKIPSFTGRKYFNFVMADIKYSSDTNLPEDIKEDIKGKYAIGITCLHKVNSAWDFAQQYENYETSLE